MDIDEDDDFYGNEDPAVETSTTGPATEAAAPENKSSPKVESKSEELEEGEEEDEGGAMDEDEDDSVRFFPTPAIILLYPLSSCAQQVTDSSGAF